MNKSVMACMLKPNLSPWSHRSLKRLVSLSNQLKGVVIGTIAFLFVACGDTVENVNQMGMEVVSSEKDLPKCDKDNEGEQALVKGESVVRVCVEGKWAAMDGAGGKYSCSTEELKDKSGLKIICDGDSIGVVYNGTDGKAGKDGADGEDGKDGADGKDVVADTTVVDSERVAISLDSLVGVTQKGPFLKGSTVYLYELSDGRTLKQTNGNFTSNITRDDGRYKFLARDLVSQYAMVVVDGYYRNEVTGVSSNAPIRLKAITDMRKRSSVNVNLLTHLEFERVYHLVTRGDSTGKKLTVKQAKRQAQREILNEFHMVLGDSTDAEDMDVFGSSDADAALLAISVLLQGDRTESEMMALLSEISTDMAEDGKWNDEQAELTKTQIADWAFTQNLYKIRKNMIEWQVGDSIVFFEHYIESFIAETYGIKVCIQNDTTKQIVQNRFSRFNGEKYECLTVDRNIAPSWCEVRDNPYLNDSIQYEQMIDLRTRRVYNILELDGTIWMAENLDYDYKENGMTYGNYCYRDSCKIYGRYYRWDVAKNACPEGWRLPYNEEWNKMQYLITRLDKDVTYLDVNMIVAKGAWSDSADNSLGFSAIPMGALFPEVDLGDSKIKSFVVSEGEKAAFWTNSTSYSWELLLNRKTVSFTDTNDSFALPVRCVKQDTVVTN